MIEVVIVVWLILCFSDFVANKSFEHQSLQSSASFKILSMSSEHWSTLKTTKKTSSTHLWNPLTPYLSLVPQFPYPKIRLTFLGSSSFLVRKPTTKKGQRLATEGLSIILQLLGSLFLRSHGWKVPGSSNPPQSSPTPPAERRCVSFGLGMTRLGLKDDPTGLGSAESGCFVGAKNHPLLHPIPTKVPGWLGFQPPFHFSCKLKLL